MAKEVLQISFQDRIVNLHFEEFDQDIDIDELTKIDWTNLYAEIITVPALMNRVGIWKAEAENAQSASKLDADIYAAQRAEHYRKSLVVSTTDAKGNPKRKYPTKDQVDNAVLLDSEVQSKLKRKLRLQKEAAYMDALYWAVKSKEMKLNRISDNMGFAPEDFEKGLVEGKFNGIFIKAKEKLIK